jgi:hypothetical protein
VNIHIDTLIQAGGEEALLYNITVYKRMERGVMPVTTLRSVMLGSTVVLMDGKASYTQMKSVETTNKW